MTDRVAIWDVKKCLWFIYYLMLISRESELSNRGVWQIAQEVVYQWLGDFATPFWWSDAHINKALASYLAAVTSFKVL